MGEPLPPRKSWIISITYERALRTIAVRDLWLFMPDWMNTAAIGRLKDFFDGIGAVLGSDSRRESFALYAMGLLGDGERKSVEPIAARACPDPKRADAMHQRLHHFVVDARWSDEAVRREAAEYVVEAMTEREPIDSWDCR